MSMISEIDHTPQLIGNFEITIVKGGLGAVFWKGIEILRGVNCLVRDANWGTYDAENFAETHIRNVKVQTIRQTFTVNNGIADVEVEISVDPSGQLELIAKITAKDDLMTNRAGLVILHPIAKTAGSELNITHPDGSATATQFPQLIAPSQPAMNIAGLNHTIGVANMDLHGVRAHVEFIGDDLVRLADLQGAEHGGLAFGEPDGTARLPLGRWSCATGADDSGRNEAATRQHERDGALGHLHRTGHRDESAQAAPHRLGDRMVIFELGEDDDGHSGANADERVQLAIHLSNAAMRGCDDDDRGERPVAGHLLPLGDS